MFDDIVPFWMGKKMYELANNPKQSYFINENNHLVTYDENLMKNMDIFYFMCNLFSHLSPCLLFIRF